MFISVSVLREAQGVRLIGKLTQKVAELSQPGFKVCALSIPPWSFGGQRKAWTKELRMVTQYRDRNTVSRKAEILICQRLLDNHIH